MLSVTLHEESHAANDTESNKHDEDLQQPVTVSVDLSGKYLDKNDIDEGSGGQTLKHGGYQTAREVVDAPHTHSHPDPDRDGDTKRDAELHHGGARQVLPSETYPERKRHQTLVNAYADCQVDELQEIRLQSDGHALEQRVQTKGKEQHHAAQPKFLLRQVGEVDVRVSDRAMVCSSIRDETLSGAVRFAELVLVRRTVHVLALGFLCRFRLPRLVLWLEHPLLFPRQLDVATVRALALVIRAHRDYVAALDGRHLLLACRHSFDS